MIVGNKINFRVHLCT